MKHHGALLDPHDQPIIKRNRSQLIQRRPTLKTTPTDKGAIIFLQMALEWIRYLPQTAAVVKPITSTGELG